MTIERLRGALADRYWIERELGAGGMATVYVAEDLKHHRKVAIKVLRPELAAVIGAERFLAEIRTTANLQHPHILALIDSGDTDGMLWYVMPYVEGESLRDRITREKQLPIADAVRIATEVAGALDYAHRHNVIHRDIKPENILLHDGAALVADFGIALAASSGAGTRMTETGMSLGTPHYMSPEQAMGEREITARSDVYALGCITYEMLVGEPPFNGPTAQAIIARVMTEEPRALSLQRKTVPPGVEAAVLTALEKLPADRYNTAAEFAAALTHTGTTSRRTAPAAKPVPGSGRRAQLLFPAVAALFGVAALWGWLRPGPTLPPDYQRVVLWHHRVGDFLNPGTARVQSQVAIAPDGSHIAFTDSVGNTSQLMIKARGELDATPIVGTEGAMSPFFSRDGQWVAYFGAGGRLKKVPVSGGGSVPLADSASATYMAGDWLDDNTIIFVGQNNGGLRRVSGDGGPTTIVRKSSSGNLIYPAALSALPGSRGVLFTGCPGNCASGSAVYVFDFRTDSTRLLVDGAAGAWYASTGQLLYTTRDGGLYAAGFDLKRMVITSGAVPVVPGVAPSRFTLSRSGSAIYSVGTRNLSESQLVWVARDGSEEPFDSAWHAAFEYPALAPDGRTLAVSIRGAFTQLWIQRADGSRRKVSVGDQGTWRAAWTPDQRAFSFVTTLGVANAASAGLGNDLYESPIDGSTPPRRTLHVDGGIWEAEYSHDGEWQIIRRDKPGAFGVVLVRRLHGDTALKVILDDGSFNAQVALSPDTRWLAFTSDVSGTAEVYVASFPDMKVRYPITQGGGTEPRWAHSGRELFYKSGGKLMSLPVAPGPTFTPGIPRPLFSLSGYSAAINHQQYDVAPDDRHFLMIREPSGGPVPDVVYVENFLADLKAKVKK